MNPSAPMNLQPDDPRLTAFALGELEGEEHARMAAAVAADPALQAAVAEIGVAVSQLSAALAFEPTPAVEPIEFPTLRPAPVRRLPRPHVRARMFRFPYVTIGSLAAACFAVVFFLQSQQRRMATESVQAAPPFAGEPAEPELAATMAPSADTPPPATAARVADTMPLATSEAPVTRITIAPPPPLPAPSATIAPSIAIATDVDPNPTPEALNQNPALVPETLAGLNRQRPNSNDAAARPFDPPVLPPTLADTATLGSRGGVVGQAALPPPAPRDQAAVGENLASYQDVLGAGTSASEQLRLTFRDFGARRYPNTAAPAPTTNRPGSVVFAANPNGPDNPSPPDRTVTSELRRVPEENVKVTAPTSPRIAYEQPIAGVTVRDEINDLGTLDRGRSIPDLETQLRDLQAHDGSLDSPVQDFVRDNPFVATNENPASVFPVVVDGASHVNVRRALRAGARPARDLVHIEELINIHDFDYAAPPVDSAAPFAASLETAAAPWAPTHRLVRVGLKTREVAPAERPAGHFVLLVETGDADAPGSQLGLIKEALRRFVERLAPGDQVAITVHSAAASLTLPSTYVRDRDTILDAIAAIRPAGAAFGTHGLQLAYDIARSHYLPGGINRVILATDGDTRVGLAGRDTIVRLVDQQAAGGIVLSALGFGVRDIRDSTLEQIAHRGAGELAFVDTLHDVDRALVDRANGAFTTVARNVKVQVEFNPAQVHSWRLIGYEDRVFLREDFDHESLAADTIGAGQATTALFEIIPTTPSPAVDDPGAEMLTVKVRYSAPTEDQPRLQQFTLANASPEFADASADFKFAAAVAGFGMLLRDSPHRGTTTIADVAAWARAGQGDDRSGSRAEFIGLVDRWSGIVR